MGIAHALDHSFLAALPPVLLLVADDLRVSLGEISVAATFAYLLFGAGALIGGPLSDRIGEGRVIFLSLGLAGASTLVLFVDRGYVGLVAMLVLSALWTSFYHPTANSLISKRYSDEMGKVMGFHGVCGSIGQVFVPSVAVLLAIAIGWRFSFVFLGILSVMVSIYFSRIPSTRRERRAIGVRSAMFRGRRFWILLGYNIMMGLYFRGTELFLPAYLTKVRGLSIEVSALAVSLLLAFGVLGQFLGGVAGDRMGSAKALLLESIVLSAGFAFLQFEGLISAIVFLILFGVAFYATQPTTNALAADVSSPEQRGVVYGIMFFTVFGLGSISSMVAGRAAELSGLQLAFSVMFLFSLIALGASIILSRVWGAQDIAEVASAHS
jgi:MFS family permease